MKKYLVTGMLLLVGSGFLFGCQKEEDVKQLPQKSWETQNESDVSIHDPSVIAVEGVNGEETFYLLGSHLAQAKTTDWLTWEVPFSEVYENMDNNIIYGNVQKNLAETFEWAGYDDADSEGGYSIWAPAVIWNPTYQWSDGSSGAYMLYYSASSTWRRSAIGLAVAKTVEGPYSYDATVVYSGFTEKDATDGSERNTNYKNTPLNQLIEKGVISGFNAKWVIEDGLTYNTDYAPNAIDPALFYDEDNRLWMVYGSWSGGIFLLEIDPTNGHPLYPGEDGTTMDGRKIDRYFGTQLSGGYHQSGEGPYIVYDETAGYYYLFVTYGGLAAKGGYNMRLFRSESPDGPYVDAQGNTPILEMGEQNSQYGIKLIGNYQFSQQKIGYRAAGHNSALIDSQGNWYLIYHTRFNNGTENHEVRVNRMYINQAGWPVVAPFSYNATEELASNATIEELAGTYEIINHGTDNGKTMLKSQTIQLEIDGQVTGDITGSWRYEAENLSIMLEEVLYTGVLLLQQTDAPLGQPSVTFSTIGTNNESIWGVRLTE